jgi:hypothetical protein
MTFTWSCALLDARPADPAETESDPPPATAAAATGRVLVINEKLSDDAWRVAHHWGAQRGRILYETHFDPKHVGEPDLERVRDPLLAIPPDYTGYACLDWENPVFGWLKEDPDSPEFRKAIESMTALIRYAKRMRPRAQWGFYGLPLRARWNRDEKWRGWARALAPLIAEVDVLYPSVYDLYRDGEQSRPGADEAYVRDNVQLALEIAGDRPVLAYVMRRYHNSNKLYQRQRIPADELTRHVRAAFQAEHEGRRAKGIVWWGADDWSIRRGNLREDMNPGESPQAYLDRINVETLRILTEAVFKDPALQTGPVGGS